MIRVSVDSAATRRMLDAGQKHVRYAAMLAINNCAFHAMRAGRKEIESKIDKPTRWTVTSWYVRRKATKQKLEAVVGWSDYLANKKGEAADYYLSQHWNGGGRKHKAFEKRLIDSGVMPSGLFAVPGKAAEDLKMIDRFGNMKAGVLVAILSGLGTFNEAGYNANASVRSGKRRAASKTASRHVYWAGKPGKNTPNGIWIIDDKHGARGRLRPVMVFVRSPVYAKRLDLKSISNSAPRNFDVEFAKAYRQALATAR